MTTIGSKFGHLWSDKVVRVVSPNAPYAVPTLFHLVPTIFGHQRPYRPNSSHIGPFGPILGPPRVQIWPFMEWQSGQSGQSICPLYCFNLVPPCSNHFWSPETI